MGEKMPGMKLHSEAWVSRKTVTAITEIIHKGGEVEVGCAVIVAFFSAP